MAIGSWTHILEASGVKSGRVDFVEEAIFNT